MIFHPVVWRIILTLLGFVNGKISLIASECFGSLGGDLLESSVFIRFLRRQGGDGRASRCANYEEKLMRFFSPLTQMVFWALIAGTVRADGLVHQLPDDGGWARFNARFIYELNGRTRTLVGAVTVSSVGATVVNGEKCRWIEVNTQARAAGMLIPINIIKVLIPEKNLKKGESLLKHVRKAWVKHPESKPSELKEHKARERELGMLLTSALKGVKNLGKKVVESKLGKLECAGQVGHIQCMEGKRLRKVTIRTRLHEKAPFGIVTYLMKFEPTKTGRNEESGSWILILADFGTKAKSALPDHN